MRRQRQGHQHVHPPAVAVCPLCRAPLGPRHGLHGVLVLTLAQVNEAWVVLLCHLRLEQEGWRRNAVPVGVLLLNNSVEGLGKHLMGVCVAVALAE